MWNKIQNGSIALFSVLKTDIRTHDLLFTTTHQFARTNVRSFEACDAWDAFDACDAYDAYDARDAFDACDARGLLFEKHFLALVWS
jgi:hypothetical protein